MNTASLVEFARREPDAARALVTPAEMEVWRLIALGFSQTDTATRLGKSRKTVEHQMAGLRRKLGARGPADLTRSAIRYGIITVEVEQ